MTNRLTLLAAALALTLFGVFQVSGSQPAEDEQEFARDKCIENCS